MERRKLSYIMHTKRLNCLDFIKRFLREHKKVERQRMKLEIMQRFNFSGLTADRYINDIIMMGVAKCNSSHLVYLQDEKGT